MANQKLSQLPVTESLSASDRLLLTRLGDGSFESMQISAKSFIDGIRREVEAYPDNLLSTAVSAQVLSLYGSGGRINVPGHDMDTDGLQAAVLVSEFDPNSSNAEISTMAVPFQSFKDQIAGAIAGANLKWQLHDLNDGHPTAFDSFDQLSAYCFDHRDSLADNIVAYVKDAGACYLYGGQDAIPNGVSYLPVKGVVGSEVQETGRLLLLGAKLSDVQSILDTYTTQEQFAYISNYIDILSRPTHIHAVVDDPPIEEGSANPDGQGEWEGQPATEGCIVICGTDQYIALRQPEGENDTEAWRKIADSRLYLTQYEADIMFGEISAAISSLHEYQHTTLTPEWADSHDSATSAVSSDMQVIASVSATSETLSAPGAGDTVIVRKPIFPGNSPTLDTAYSWYDGEWRALQGNYSADNVFFDCDIKLAGNWVNVGNIKKDSTEATGTYEAKGKSIKQILSAMFCAASQPAITAQPSVGLTATVNGQSLTTTRWFEVGTPLTSLTYNASFNPGSYTAYEGQVATGVTASAWNAQLSNVGNSTTVETKSTKDGSFAQLTATDGMQLKVKQTATHGQGAIAKNNMGDDSYPVVRIAAGSKSAVTAGVARAFRQGFYGYRLASEGPLDFDSMTSQDIRSNIHAVTWNFTNGAWPTKFTVPTNSTQIIFAVPATADNNHKFIKMNNPSLGNYLFDNDGQLRTPGNNLFVNGYGNTAGTGTAYKIWTINPPGPFAAAAEYNITYGSSKLQ